MGDTKIDWATKVWNPTTGCTKVSQGCKNCYAETIAKRFWAIEYMPNSDGSLRKFTDVRIHPERLEKPLHWRKPQRVFVDSMSDLFHPDVSFDFIDQVFACMMLAPQHIFMVLTKRSKRMLEYFNHTSEGGADVYDLVGFEAVHTFKMIPKIGGGWPLPNIWLGVSVEDQATADERIPLLLQTPAAVRFVSYEPALGPLILKNYFASHINPPRFMINGELIYSDLDWVIMGCESGPNARPMDIEWARSTRDQCAAAGVPFFFKQKRVGKTILHTPSLDGVYWQQFPESVSVETVEK